MTAEMMTGLRSLPAASAGPLQLCSQFNLLPGSERWVARSPFHVPDSSIFVLSVWLNQGHVHDVI